MTALWSPEQQAWLKALGHRVLVLAGDEPVMDAPARDSVGDARPDARVANDDAHHVVRARGADTGTPAVERARPRPSLPPAESGAASRRDVPGEVASAGPPRSTASRAPDDALERAVLRVTGQRTRSEARAVLQRLEVDVHALRGNPAAKRALWLKLRPLQPRFRP